VKDSFKKFDVYKLENSLMINFLLKLNFANITSVRATPLREKGKIRIRASDKQAREAQNLTDSKHSKAVFVKAGARNLSSATQQVNNFYETSGSISHPLVREMSKGGKPRGRNQAGNCSVSGPG
jgi:hypothetical protein